MKPIAEIINICRTFLLIALFISNVHTAFAERVDPSILVHPSTNVEVGEEVLFDASGTMYKDAALLRKARYEWDFGDGHTFKYGSPFYDSYHNMAFSGLVTTHYFMTPGSFVVKLSVCIFDKFDRGGRPVTPAIVCGTTERVICVIGEAPMAGFEIQRASFHNRLAQYLYITIPVACRGNQTALRVTLEGKKGSRKIICTKTNLSNEERIFLDHKPLIEDEYVVIAELLNGKGQRLQGGLWRDKFSKRYQAVPKVGIDENNAFRLNGDLFFPIGAFMTDGPRIKTFVDRTAINMLHTEGYYPTMHSPPTWKDYLNKSQANNLLCIGPGRGDYSVNENPNRWRSNHNTDRMAQYIHLNKDHPALFAWSWLDEPNMGGWSQKVYAPTLAAWSYVCHRDDPQHPSFNLFYGSDWSKRYGTGPNYFDYLGSAPLFGGKKWVQDAIPFDIYPIQNRLHSSMNFDDMGPYAAYLDALDRIQLNNKNLVPVLPVIQPCQRNPSDSTRPHSGDQVYLEAWMNVIHGAKGIIWFPYFDQTSIRWMAMKRFADQMKALGPIVLGPQGAHTVTDDADSALRRVDTLIREEDGSVYLFTARVTEPDPIEGAKYRGVEPNSITVNFKVSGFTGNNAAEVLDEDRTVFMTNGRFADTFVKNAVHIYKIVSLRSRVKHGDFILPR